MESSYIILIALLVGMIVYGVINYFRHKKIITLLDQEAFIQGYRKAQLIDVREPNEFESGHILGARNIPSTQLKMRMKEIRLDRPVYLYCQNMARSTRAAEMLYKNGHRDIYQLKGGYKNWTGRIKVGN